MKGEGLVLSFVVALGAQACVQPPPVEKAFPVPTETAVDIMNEQNQAFLEISKMLEKFINREYLGTLIFSNYQKIITPTATTTRADVMANPDGSDQPTRPFNISIIDEIGQPKEIRIGLGTIDNPWKLGDLRALSYEELTQTAGTIFNLPKNMEWTSSLESPNKVAGTGQDRQGKRFSVTLGNNGTGALTITFDN